MSGSPTNYTRSEFIWIGELFMSKKQRQVNWVIVAGFVSLIIIGCGGTSSTQGLNGSVVTTGGFQTAAGSGTPGKSTGSTPQQVQVTVNGQSVNATLPANETIPVSGTVATIAPNVPILIGLSPAPKTGGAAKPPSVSGGATGEVDVDGCNTGLTVTSNGSLSGYLAMVPGNHRITAIGPFTIVGGTVFSPTSLTVGQFIFDVNIGTDGISSIPATLGVNLPINGGTFKAGHYVRVGVSTPDYATAKFTLTLTWPAASLIQTEGFVGGFGTYKAFRTNLTVPAEGISTVQWSYIGP